MWRWSLASMRRWWPAWLLVATIVVLTFVLPPSQPPIRGHVGTIVPCPFTTQPPANGWTFCPAVTTPTTATLGPTDPKFQSVMGGHLEQGTG
jgi:hypothetical protein